jgi:hypothetical protein
MNAASAGRNSGFLASSLPERTAATKQISGGVERIHNDENGL